jgi:hypothetical protein
MFYTMKTTTNDNKTALNKQTAFQPKSQDSSVLQPKTTRDSSGVWECCLKKQTKTNNR